jgi:hypothetical protein
MDVQNGGTDDAGPARGWITLKAETGVMVIYLIGGGQLDSETSGILNFELLGRENKPVNQFETNQFFLHRPISRDGGINADTTHLDTVAVDQNSTTAEPVDSTWSVGVLCLHLGKTTISTGGPLLDIFLVLVKREDSGRVHYSRIGFMQATLNEESLQDWFDGSDIHEVTIY